MFQNSSGTRPAGPPDSCQASPLSPCKQRPNLQSSFGRNLCGTQDKKALSLAEERKGSTHNSLHSQLTTASEKLPWAAVAKDKRSHLKGRNSICSFVDTGVLPGDWRPTVWDCLARNSSEGLPLRSRLLRPSVYVLTIFGNKNQRGQWLSSGWKGKKKKDYSWFIVPASYQDQEF